MDPIGFALALPFGDEVSQPLKKRPIYAALFEVPILVAQLSIKWKPVRLTPLGVLWHFPWGLKFSEFQQKDRFTSVFSKHKFSFIYEI